MRIRRLELAGDSHRPDLELVRLGNGVNIITGCDATGRSTLASCMAHLLFGRPVSRELHTSGSIDIESSSGEYRLRREYRADRTCRLTISSRGQEAAKADTITHLLHGAPPAFLSGLYFHDGAQGPRVDWLLSEGVAATVTQLCGKTSIPPSIDPDATTSVGGLPLDEIDDLIQSWSATLRDLERREAQVRSELAKEQHIDRTDYLSLADQRGAVAAIERLVKDLQGEVETIERAGSSQACAFRDARTRLQPLLGHLQQQVTRLTKLIAGHERALNSHELRAEAKHLQRLQAESRDRIEHLQRQRDSILGRPSQRRPSGKGRASEFLSRLSEGEFVEIKLTSGGRRALVVDCRDKTHMVESLSIAERRLVELSLSLAILSGLSEAGLRLPVVLDEPFYQLSDRQVGKLAKVLNDLKDHQIFVFTRRQSALDYFGATDSLIHDLDRLPVECDQPGNRLPETANPTRDAANSKPALRIKRDQSEAPRRSKRSSGKRSSNKRTPSKRPSPEKFTLDLQSPIEEAPSIPAELAKVLSQAEIRQVRDLLAADASKLADRLDHEVDPVDIVVWQHQARLCCRIPNLKPRDAAILVNCGFSTPEDVASMKASELLEFIRSFASTEEGGTILGDDGEPELDTVKNWIRAARRSRVLGAA